MTIGTDDARESAQLYDEILYDIIFIGSGKMISLLLNYR